MQLLQQTPCPQEKRTPTSSSWHTTHRPARSPPVPPPAAAEEEDGQFEDVDVSGGDAGYEEADFGVPAASIQMAVVGARDDFQEESV